MGGEGVWSNIIGAVNIMHDKGIIIRGTLQKVVGNCTSILFWKDVWVGNAPLKSMFLTFYLLKGTRIVML